MKCKFKALVLAAMTAALLQGCATTKLSGPPDVMFKEGEESFKKGNYEDAIAQWKKVKESYQSPELSARAEINIADAYFLNKDYIEAAAAYEDFRKLHPNHEKVAYALYRLGLCYYKQITGIDTDQTPVKSAVNLLDSFLRQYPKSEYTAEVRALLDECMMKQVQYEIYVGRFYLRTDKYAAAIKRLEEALVKYPKSAFHDETLFYLGKAYFHSGDKVKGKATFNRLANEFASSKFLAEAKQVVEK